MHFVDITLPPSLVRCTLSIIAATFTFMSNSCLNCHTKFAGNYCPECGQRSNVERFTLPYFFSSGFLSTTFNLDRGFFHTCLNLCYRPGHMVREYLGGRRKEYFNFIAFLLILLGIEALLWSFGYNSPADMMQQQVNNQLATSMPDLNVTLTKSDVESVLANQKFLFLPAIPVAAIIPWLVFKRTGFNFMEHAVAVCFLLAMNTLLGISLGLLGLLPIDFGVYGVIYLILANIILVYDFVFYWQLSKQASYTNGGRLWRMLAAGFSVLIVVNFTLQMAVGFKAGIRSEMTAEEQKTETPLDAPPVVE